MKWLGKFMRPDNPMEYTSFFDVDFGDRRALIVKCSELDSHVFDADKFETCPLCGFTPHKTLVDAFRTKVSYQQIK